MDTQIYCLVLVFGLSLICNISIENHIDDRDEALSLSCASILTSKDPSSPVINGTCPYPELFSTETWACRPFYEVECGPNRTELVSPCAYPDTNCSWLDDPQRLCSCPWIPDLNFDVCEGLGDGHYPWAVRKWTRYYIECRQNRTRPSRCNGTSDIFSFIDKTCDSLANVVNEAYKMSIVQNIPSTLLHLVDESLYTRSTVYIDTFSNYVDTENSPTAYIQPGSDIIKAVKPTPPTSRDTMIQRTDIISAVETTAPTKESVTHSDVSKLVDPGEIDSTGTISSGSTNFAYNHLRDTMVHNKQTHPSTISVSNNLNSHKDYTHSQIGYHYSSLQSSMTDSIRSTHNSYSAMDSTPDLTFYPTYVATSTDYVHVSDHIIKRSSNLFSKTSNDIHFASVTTIKPNKTRADNPDISKNIHKSRFDDTEFISSLDQTTTSSIAPTPFLNSIQDLITTVQPDLILPSTVFIQISSFPVASLSNTSRVNMIEQVESINDISAFSESGSSTLSQSSDNISELHQNSQTYTKSSSVLETESRPGVNKHASGTLTRTYATNLETRTYSQLPSLVLKDIWSSDIGDGPSPMSEDHISLLHSFTSKISSSTVESSQMSYRSSYHSTSHVQYSYIKSRSSHTHTSVTTPVTNSSTFIKLQSLSVNENSSSVENAPKNASMQDPHIIHSTPLQQSPMFTSTTKVITAAHASSESLKYPNTPSSKYTTTVQVSEVQSPQTYTIYSTYEPNQTVFQNGSPLTEIHSLTTSITQSETGVDTSIVSKQIETPPVSTSSIRSLSNISTDYVSLTLTNELSQTAATVLPITERSFSLSHRQSSDMSNLESYTSSKESISHYGATHEVASTTNYPTSTIIPQYMYIEPSFMAMSSLNHIDSQISPFKRSVTNTDTPQLLNAKSFSPMSELLTAPTLVLDATLFNTHMLEISTISATVIETSTVMTHVFQTPALSDHLLDTSVISETPLKATASTAHRFERSIMTTPVSKALTLTEHATETSTDYASVSETPSIYTPVLGSSIESASLLKALALSEVVMLEHSIAPESIIETTLASIKALRSSIVYTPALTTSTLHDHVLEATIVSANVFETPIITMSVSDSSTLSTHVLKPVTISEHMLEATAISTPVLESPIIATPVLESSYMSAVESNTLKLADVFETSTVTASVLEMSASSMKELDTLTTAAPVLSNSATDTRVLHVSTSQTETTASSAVLQTSSISTPVLESTWMSVPMSKPSPISKHMLETSTDFTTVLEASISSTQELDISTPSAHVLNNRVINTHLSSKSQTLATLVQTSLSSVTATVESQSSVPVPYDISTIRPEDKLTSGLIVGISLGAIALVSVVIVAGLFIVRRRHTACLNKNDLTVNL